MSEDKNLQYIDGKVVYLIEHPEGPIKIGVSNDPERRLKDINSMSPYESEVVGVINAEEPFEAESNLHDKFDTEQLSGEWFDLYDYQIGYLKQLSDLNGRELERQLKSAEEQKENALKEAAMR